MTPLRMKRLLWLAYNGGNCKAFYSQYLKLHNLGYGDWMLGHFWLSEDGIKMLEMWKDD